MQTKLAKTNSLQTSTSPPHGHIIFKQVMLKTQPLELYVHPYMQTFIKTRNLKDFQGLRKNNTMIKKKKQNPLTKIIKNKQNKTENSLKVIQFLYSIITKDLDFYKGNWKRQLREWLSKRTLTYCRVWAFAVVEEDRIGSEFQLKSKTVRPLPWSVYWQVVCDCDLVTELISAVGFNGSRKDGQYFSSLVIYRKLWLTN